MVAQTLLGTVDDGMSDAGRTQLGAALERSLADVDAGRTTPFADVMAELRARRAVTVALELPTTES